MGDSISIKNLINYYLVEVEGPGFVETGLYPMKLVR
jgi:hypothetical protein